MTIVFSELSSAHLLTEDGVTDLKAYGTTRVVFDGPVDEWETGRPLGRMRVSVVIPFDPSPGMYRTLFGRAHPRVRRMHSRYPKRWRRR